MELDNILNPEQEYYNEGYRDGLKDGEAEALIEGREFGVQTAFQRFFALGVISGQAVIFEKSIKKKKTAATQVAGLVREVPIDNSDTSVEIYEKSVKKIRNRARIMDKDVVKEADEASNKIAGRLNVAAPNQEDMW